MSSKDLTGQQFGKLEVLRRVGTRNKQVVWECKCQCGQEITVLAGNLRNGSTLSCGCLNRKKVAERQKTHGETNTRLYRIWHNMKSRCQNPNIKDYADYGGRGITVCPEWRDSFEAFRDWALANGYQDNLTIERNNINGNYEPQNCKWITNREQQSNRRNNRIISGFGRTQTIQQWADETGVSRETIAARLKRGWPTEIALTAPVKNKEEK